MRVLTVAAGSWGDVLLPVPPALELQRRGHYVRVAAPPVFRVPLRRMGLKPIPVGSFIRRETLTSFH